MYKIEKKTQMNRFTIKNANRQTTLLQGDTDIDRRTNV